jgi:tetratricopeptide (TPR) repeat protein
MRRYFLLFSFIHFFTTLHAQQSQPDKVDSLTHLLKIASIDSVKVDLLNQLGFEHWTVDGAQAERYGNQALKLSKQSGYKLGEAMASRVMGVSHWARGNLIEALPLVLKGRDWYKSIGNTLGEGNCTMNIGMVYDEQQDKKKALDYYFAAVALFKKLNNDQRIAIAFTKIGTIYTEQKKFDEALRYLNDAFAIHKKNKFDFGILEINNRLGLLCRDKGELKKAENHLTESLSIARKKKDQEHIAKNLENLASTYLLKGDLAKAETCLKEAYPIAEHNGYKKWLRDVLRDYKDLSLMRNDPSDAVYYFSLYENLKDSIFSEEKAAQLANLQLEYAMAENEKGRKLQQQEIQLLQQQSRLNRIFLFLLIGGIVVLAIVGYVIFRTQRYRIQKNKELLLQQRQLAQSQQELAQIEIENAKLKEKELNSELEFKNKELTSYTINFIRKNELMEEFKVKLEELKKQLPSELTNDVNSLHRMVQNNNIDKDWEDFKLTFEGVHHNFFSSLIQRFPELSPTELKLCAMLRLNFNLKETAAVMGISSDSVKTSRYRLRKKLNLPAEQNLTDFVMGFGQS